MIRDIQTTFESPVEENFQFMKTMTIKGLKRKGVYMMTNGIKINLKKR